MDEQVSLSKLTTTITNLEGQIKIESKNCPRLILIDLNIGKLI